MTWSEDLIELWRSPFYRLPQTVFRLVLRHMNQYLQRHCSHEARVTHEGYTFCRDCGKGFPYERPPAPRRVV